METYKPKTIKEAIENLQQFLECDLYTKFRPEEKINGASCIRSDSFKDVNDFHKYIKVHFDILIKQGDDLNECSLIKPKSIPSAEEVKTSLKKAIKKLETLPDQNA